MNKKITGYASIDKPWLKYYPNEFMKKEQIESSINKSMYQMYDECTKDIEENVTIEYFGQEITNKELKRRILECAKSFLVMGVKKGDIVPLILPNQPESRILIYALNYIGAVAYPIQPTLPTAQLNKILDENNVKNMAIFRDFYRHFKTKLKKVDNIIYTTAKESLPKIVQDADYISHMLPKDVIPYNNFILEHKSFSGVITPEYEFNTVAAIIGTSGTTGIPKGVCLTNENLNAMTYQHLYGDMNFSRGDKLLNILIDSIGYGLGTMHYSECCGIKSILIPTLVTNVAPLFLKYRPNHFTGGPIHAEELEKFLKDPNNKNVVDKLTEILNNDVKNWVSGGAPLKKETENFLNNEKILVRQGLGCTENGGAATYSKKGTYKANSVGIPLMLETMSIFEKGTDHELKYNEEGEICITGPTVMKEYFNNAEETNKLIKIHRDGKRWIHTGDKGYIDSDGNIFIIGRYKNMTHRLGFNIHPEAITNTLSKSNVKGVLDYHVITLPHPKEQNVPVAIISIEPKYRTNQGINRIKKELQSFCKEHFDQYECPYDYIFIKGNIVRNLGGKVDEKSIIEMSGLNYTQDNYGPKTIVIDDLYKQKVKKR